MSVEEYRQCENCEHHDYCEWLHEYQDFGIVCNDYTESENNI